VRRRALEIFRTQYCQTLSLPPPNKASQIISVLFNLDTIPTYETPSFVYSAKSHPNVNVYTLELFDLKRTVAEKIHCRGSLPSESNAPQLATNRAPGPSKRYNSNLDSARCHSKRHSYLDKLNAKNSLTIPISMASDGVHYSLNINYLDQCDTKKVNSDYGFGRNYLTSGFDLSTSQDATPRPTRRNRPLFGRQKMTARTR
jgi:hypothetical protein